MNHGGMDGIELLEAHLASFNHGVRTGDFEPMFARFTDDAELIFEGPPVGPFRGLDAIRAAYAAQPPDDTLTPLGHSIDGDRLIVNYAWDAAPADLAGIMIIERSGDRIGRLTVRFVGQS
jgi:hypothetical protein